jgi:BRCT domain type II-containing protein
MARTKQTCRKPAQRKPSLHKVKATVGKKKSAGQQKVRSAGPKKAGDVFNCDEMTRALEDAVETGVPSRELEDAAVRALASVFDCSQLRDALLETVPRRVTVFPKDIQGGAMRLRGERS